MSTEAAYASSIPSNWLMRVSIIWTAFAMTSFTSIASSYSFAWYVTSTTGNALAITAVSVCAFLPQGIVSPLGGLVADRYNRRNILIVCNIVLVLVTGSMAFLLMLGYLSLPLVLVCTTILGIRQGFRDPAFNSLMPLIVPQSSLMRINMLDTILMSMSMIFAPTIGIALYTAFGLTAVMMIAAVAGALSALSFLLVKVPTVRETANAGIISNFGEGLKAVKGKRGLLALIITITVGFAAYGPVDSLLPFMVTEKFAGSGYLASFVTGVFGAGAVLGGISLMALGGRVPLTRVISVCALSVGVGITAAGLVPGTQLVIFVVMIGIVGFACAGFNGPATTIFQTHVKPEKLGRVMGLFSACLALGNPLGTTVGGVAASILGVSPFFVADGLLVLVVACVFALLPSVRSLDTPSSDNGAQQ